MTTEAPITEAASAACDVDIDAIPEIGVRTKATLANLTNAWVRVTARLVYDLEEQKQVNSRVEKSKQAFRELAAEMGRTFEDGTVLPIGNGTGLQVRNCPFSEGGAEFHLVPTMHPIDMDKQAAPAAWPSESF